MYKSAFYLHFLSKYKNLHPQFWNSNKGPANIYSWFQFWHNSILENSNSGANNSIFLYLQVLCWNSTYAWNYINDTALSFSEENIITNTIIKHTHHSAYNIPLLFHRLSLFIYYSPSTLRTRLELLSRPKAPKILQELPSKSEDF